MLNTITRDFDALRWHLSYNFLPTYTQAAIDQMIEVIKRFDAGELDANDEIVEGSNVTVAQLMEDLRIESLK